ncbi:heme oxygenase domain-containing protein [Rhizoctonia solani AG-1 IA]|uniref:Heme oxygenase domain-containing protein n=1 Tax=Thanatephorus cucumeris (strain AG1-IA) TaxID=983506 RepID=L8WMX2_THACA|nr:heme oxygenase domain-containing protein [Rhizoctonia solani AG-1 IA]
MQAPPSPLDFSRPISTLIYGSTKTIHDEITRMPFAGKLTRGELPKEEYVFYAMALYQVYSALEKGLDAHSTNAVLAPTYRPALLHRASRLSEDIACLLDTTVDEWPSHPLYQSLLTSPPEGIRDYVAYLEKLASSKDSMNHSRLLAHGYGRYMGDLSGGQVVKTKICKAYDLPDSGAGASFYDFGVLHGGSGTEEYASNAELLRIKAWYRQGMNEGVGNNRLLKEIMIQEAVTAMNYNKRLIESASEYTPVGGDLTPAKKPRRAQESSFAVPGLVAITTTIALAHFVLVVGGFGTRSSGGRFGLHCIVPWVRDRGSLSQQSLKGSRE